MDGSFPHEGELSGADGSSTARGRLRRRGAARGQQRHAAEPAAFGSLRYHREAAV